MNPDSARWSGRYLAATHWFIPAALQQEAATLTRAENVVSAALLAATAGPFYALAYYLLGFDSAVTETLLCCAFMLTSPLLLRVSGSIVAARELFLCALFFNFTWLSYHLGGISAPTASWLITGPLVAAFLGGIWSALFWLAMSCTAAALIYLLAAGGHALPVHPVSDMATLYLVCHLGLFVVVLAFALLFELTKTQGFVKLEQALRTINELAIRDELTGVHNRRYLMNLIEREKERSDRNGRAFCLCLLDIDFFKRINDTYGHSAGDTVLRAFAQTVQALVRGSDCFGRYGGEEFLLMLPETPACDAQVLAERVRVAIDRLRCKDGPSDIALTVSIGVAEYRMGETITQAIGRADEALYLAKSSGRNRVVCHGQDEDLEPASGARARMGQGEGVGRDLGASVGRMLDGVHCDQLTGLLNRRLLRDRLRHAMDRANRNRRLVALLLLNINKFKEVNDALGYEAGDALLVQAGGIVRGCLRDCDTVARWSGDEFVALLEDLGSEMDARQVAEKILDRFGLPLAAAGRECFITLSVGVALYPAEDCDLDALLKRADVAMRSARAWGENSVQLYSSAATAPQSERLALKNGLRDALTRGQLFLEYQPQFDLATRRIVGVEALLRWQHPVYGRIDPGRFIPLAEETGMIVPIGDWVLRTACAQNRAWRDAGLPGVKTAVNLSARQLRHPDIAARVLDIVASSGLPSGCLDLEITEGVLIDDLEGNQRVMSALRAAGVLVSIDDFGTGYSSLNYLSELPVDILKMDGLFVRRLGVDPRARPYAIAEAIVAMAHSLDLKVIAEAVETNEQLADLVAIGCDEAQGYLFARPLPPEQVAALLAGQGLHDSQHAAPVPA
ncbi:bifunctional diguanylate cyclase/phosphodiesterase [Massilia sp. YIM B02769]|uniref:bifunctional diguanylate cyclase/phosphodiesterase n=1 Tax=Massilia sp. YIM B02769 TaxID=3050129 RepID=UPI0025B6CD7D|nr:bifunctional diguanylate cyclase/phosphodiesterase [Massilia sp. YIM B02769]MDN4058313.1 bifunctional diguanylate cyclase/phosphodiesterase [Massilia sp. YIM B02769]